MFKINDLTLRLEEVSPSVKRSLERLSDLDFSESSFISYEISFYLLVRCYSHANSEGNEGNLVKEYSGQDSLSLYNTERTYEENAYK